MTKKMYKVENPRFNVVFEENLTLDEAQEFIKKSEQEELEEFQNNRNVFRIVEMATEEI